METQEVIPQQEVEAKQEAVVEGAGGNELSPASEQASPSMLDKAAHDYKLLIPKFYECIEFFSKKQLHRMIEALIEYPLEMEYPKFTYENENKAFYLAMHIFDCKNLMLQEVLKLTKNKEKLAQFQEELDKLTKERQEKTNVV